MKTLLTALASALVFMGSAQAALVDRGGGMIYDDVLNITWLQDANYAKTSAYDADGRMTYDEAFAWADQLSFGGHDDWRLPGVAPVNGSFFNMNFSGYGNTDRGFNIRSTQAEMSHLHYVTLGGKGQWSPTGANLCSGYGVDSCLPDTGPFLNTGTNAYWVGSPLAIFPTAAFVFQIYGGEQLIIGRTNDAYAWAVRDGDVAPIPEPTTLALVAAALLGVAATHRRKPTIST